MLRLNVKGFDTVLITGLGPVGMGAVTIAKFLGARVIAVDTIEFRKNMAKKLGADVVLDANDENIGERIKKAKGDMPLLKAIDASGNPIAERLCIDSVDPLATVCFIGENHADFSIKPSEDFIRKGLTLVGAWHYDISKFQLMFEVMRRSEGIKYLVTETYGFTDATKAFERFMERDVCKILIKPWL